MALWNCLGVAQAERVQKLVLEQQIRAWILLGVLYMAIQDDSEITLPDKPSLPEMMRRECLSSWLKVPCYSWLNDAEACCIKAINHVMLQSYRHCLVEQATLDSISLSVVQERLLKR